MIFNLMSPDSETEMFTLLTASSITASSIGTFFGEVWKKIQKISTKLKIGGVDLKTIQNTVNPNTVKTALPMTSQLCQHK